MPQGKIKKVIADKGFGFIEGERGDIFFHHSALDGIAIEALQIGQSVTYEEGRGPKGPRRERPPRLRARIAALRPSPGTHDCRSLLPGATGSGRRRGRPIQESRICRLSLGSIWFRLPDRKPARSSTTYLNPASRKT